LLTQQTWPVVTVAMKHDGEVYSAESEASQHAKDPAVMQSQNV
jgi:hypothetical protein